MLEASHDASRKDWLAEQLESPPHVFATLLEGGLVGVQWANANELQGNFSYSLCCAMMALDALLYVALGLYLEQVVMVVIA